MSTNRFEIVVAPSEPDADAYDAYSAALFSIDPSGKSSDALAVETGPTALLAIKNLAGILTEDDLVET